LLFLKAKKGSLVDVEMHDKQSKLNVLEHGDCIGCSDFSLKGHKAGSNKVKTYYLKCRQGLDPQALFPDNWMALDKAPKCPSKR